MADIAGMLSEVINPDKNIDKHKLEELLPKIGYEKSILDNVIAKFNNWIIEEKKKPNSSLLKDSYELGMKLGRIVDEVYRDVAKAKVDLKQKLQVTLPKEEPNNPTPKTTEQFNGDRINKEKAPGGFANITYYAAGPKIP